MKLHILMIDGACLISFWKKDAIFFNLILKILLLFIYTINWCQTLDIILLCFIVKNIKKFNPHLFII